MEWLTIIGAVAGLITALIGWAREYRLRRDAVLAYEATLLKAQKQQEQAIRQAQEEVKTRYAAEKAELQRQFEAARGNPAALADWFARVQQAPAAVPAAPPNAPTTPTAYPQTT